MCVIVDFQAFFLAVKLKHTVQTVLSSGAKQKTTHYHTHPHSKRPKCSIVLQERARHTESDK